MTPEEFVTWVSLKAPTLRTRLDALEEEWGEPPPQTDVALFVIVPAFIDSVRQQDVQATTEIAALLEEMCSHEDEDLSTNIVLTIAPLLADKLSAKELSALGGRMTLQVAPYLQGTR